MAFCSNCGKELKDEWKFCEGCGAEIKVNEKTDKKEENKFNVSSSKKGSKSLKIIVGILICMLIFGVLAIILGAIAPDDGEENNIENIVEEEVIKYHNAKFSIKFIGNLIFNKYNVIFCVDDGEENTLEHGVNKDIEMSLEEGTHYLYFTNAEDSTIETKLEIDIQANTDYGFEIICYYDEISVETLYEDADIKLDETQIKMSVDKTEYVGKDYKEVVKKLNDLGFINIIEKPVYDIYWGITPEGEVESVTIDGVDTYKRGSVLSTTSEVIVTYHMKEENDPNKKAEETNTVKIEEPKEETKKEENIVEIQNTTVETTKKENKVEEEQYNFYTTNDNDMAKKGNIGKYAYYSTGAYDIYWVVDFDEGYVYWFTEGNGDNTCDKYKIKSGNLNDGVKLSFKSSENAWINAIHFKYYNQPHQLIVVDNDNFETEFETVSLKKALDLIATKDVKVR